MVKRTGPTSKPTKALVQALEKHSAKQKKAVFETIAEGLNAPTRMRAEVNLHHLQKMAEKNKDKILVVPGKILGTGEISVAVEVAAFSFSASAKEKISAAKGKVHTLRELMDKNVPANKLVLVK
jgi:large subunit ribosomal protein L18e